MQSIPAFLLERQPTVVGGDSPSGSGATHHPEPASIALCAPRTPDVPGGVSHETVRRALIQVATGESLEAIEATLRGDVVLCWRLMRYIASSNFGMLVPIDSMRCALVIVGLRRLARWLKLLLSCAPDVTPVSQRLNASAAMRGRLLQLIGAEYFEGQDLDNLFMVGAFSMLPDLLMQPMSQALEALALPDGVADALMSRQGRFGALLNLADAMQAGPEDEVHRLCEELSLSGAALARACRRAAAPMGGRVEASPMPEVST